MPNMRNAAAAAVAVLAVGFTSLHPAAPALAAPRARAPVAKEAAREASLLAARAKAAFKDGQFDEAARLFMKAYAVSGEAALVYNAARAYEEAGKAGDAVGLFRLYTTITDDPDGIADARERIRKLEAGRLGGSATGQGAAEASLPAPAGGSPEAPAAQATPGTTRPGGAGRVDEVTRPPASAPAGPPTVRQAHTRDRTWLWVALGATGAAAVGGAVLLALGASASRDANALAIRSPADVDRYNAAFDDAEALRLAGWAGLGAAALAGGAAAWLGLREPVAVALDPRGGIAVVARF